MFLLKHIKHRTYAVWFQNHYFGRIRTDEGFAKTGSWTGVENFELSSQFFIPLFSSLSLHIPKLHMHVAHIKININYSPYKYAYHLISLSMIMQHHSTCQVLYEYKQNDQGLNGFVKISASCCSVITKDRGTLYFPTWSRIKWWCTSMCFIRERCKVFFIIQIALLLSHIIGESIISKLLSKIFVSNMLQLQCILPLWLLNSTS